MDRFLEPYLSVEVPFTQQEDGKQRNGEASSKE